MSLNAERPFGEAVEQAFQRFAVHSYPYEAVALVLDDPTHGWTLLFCRNVAADPLNSFEVARDVWDTYGHQVAGLLHSHPDAPAHPSRRDMAQQAASAVPWGISTATATSATAPIWWGDQLRTRPLIGRRFVHGITDCYSVIRDWWWLERKVRLPDFPRDWEWWEHGENLYLDNFAKAGFRRLPEGTAPQVGDVGLFSIGSANGAPNHAGVVTGTDAILHHRPDKLSREWPLHGYRDYFHSWLRRD